MLRKTCPILVLSEGHVEGALNDTLQTVEAVPAARSLWYLPSEEFTPTHHDFVGALQESKDSTVIFKRRLARQSTPGCGLAVPMWCQKKVLSKELTPYRSALEVPTLSQSPTLLRVLLKCC